MNKLRITIVVLGVLSMIGFPALIFIIYFKTGHGWTFSLDDPLPPAAWGLIIYMLLAYLFEIAMAIKPLPIRTLYPATAIIHAPFAFLIPINLLACIMVFPIIFLPFAINPILFYYYIKRRKLIDPLPEPQ